MKRVRITDSWIYVTLSVALLVGMAPKAEALKMMSPERVIEALAKNKGEICIQAGNGQFLSVSAADTRRVYATQKTCGTAETFQVVQSEPGVYALYSVAQKTYLSCQPDGRLEGNRKNLGPWERFRIAGEIRGDFKRVQGRRFYIYNFQCLSHQQRFIVAEGNGGREVNANRAKVGPWEQFLVTAKEAVKLRPSPGQIATQRSRFPRHWGSQPKIQTKDLRPLPGGYGRGSSTLAKWIQRNLDRDARSGTYKTMVQLNDNGTKVLTDLGREAFNAAFKACPVVQYRRNGAVMAVYQRLTPLPANLDAYGLFVETWRNENNQLNQDFRLFDKHGALLTESSPWAFCNYNDPDVAFPRDCGKTRKTDNRWFSMPGGRFNARGLTKGASFEVHTEEHCPVPAAAKTVLAGGGLHVRGVNLVQNGDFSAGKMHWREFNHGPRRNGFHEHTWGNGHITGHLHGHCPQTAGGIMQHIPTKPGMTYTLSFDAYSGDWDGKDVDVVEVQAGSSKERFSLGPEHSVNAKNPALAERVTLQFRASEAVTSISFYAGLGHCIDVDNVSVTPLGKLGRSIWDERRQDARYDLALAESEGPFWVVAISALPSRIRAERLASELRERGEKAHIASLKGYGSAGYKDLWVVYVGPFSMDEIDAVRVAERRLRASEYRDAYAVTLGTKGQRRTLAQVDQEASARGPFECDTSINFISNLPYDQISLTDRCRNDGGRNVCNANPIYGASTDVKRAVSYCQERCLKNQSCTGFFFQRHMNGHEICGFYRSDFEMRGQGHGHAPGSQVCRRR